MGIMAWPSATTPDSAKNPSSFGALCGLQAEDSGTAPLWVADGSCRWFLTHSPAPPHACLPESVSRESKPKSVFKEDAPNSRMQKKLKGEEQKSR